MYIKMIYIITTFGFLGGQKHKMAVQPEEINLGDVWC